MHSRKHDGLDGDVKIRFKKNIINIFLNQAALSYVETDGLKRDSFCTTEKHQYFTKVIGITCDFH